MCFFINSFNGLAQGVEGLLQILALIFQVACAGFRLLILLQCRQVDGAKRLHLRLQRLDLLAQLAAISGNQHRLIEVHQAHAQLFELLVQSLPARQVALALEPQSRQLLLNFHQLLVIGASGLLQLGQLAIQLREPLVTGQLLRLKIALFDQQGRQILTRSGPWLLEFRQLQAETGQLLLAQRDELALVLLLQL